MQYNLVRNGVLRALTVSGTGNKSLTWSELESLTDMVTASGGTSLINTDVLYLEADISQRIQLDSVRLYTSDLTKLSNIDFYYKNDESDSYTILSKNVESYYYPTLVSPSAPRFVLVTVSGVDMDMYEYTLVNDDYIVAFGEYGTETNKFLGDTPVGEESDPQTVALYNNESDGLTGADAYTVIDYTGNDADQYIKISSSQNGTYVGVTDGALIEDDLLNSDIRWSQGSFSNTQVVGNNVELYSTDYINMRLSQIPLNSKSNSWYVTESAWDFDIVSKRMFCSGSDGIYKLWEYDYNNDTYTYLGELGGGGSTSEEWDGSIAVLGDRIYCMPHSTQWFGSYEIDGPQDNWTGLPNHPVAGVGSEFRRVLCSDYNRYIYCIDAARNGLTKRFYRYDTTTSGWSSLSTGYNDDSTGYNYAMAAFITYDTDRDYIYFSYQSDGTPWYIQRYNVSTNSWNTTYYNLAALKSSSTTRSTAGISYNNDNIWIAFSADMASDDIYRHDLTTGITTRYTTIGWEMNYWSGNNANNAAGYLIAIDPLLEDETPSHIFAGLIEGDPTYIYEFPGDDAYGTYTSPIFELDNVYDSSYFITEGTATSGTGSISYDEDVYNGSIRVKSSDTEPITIDEVYIAYSNDDIQRWIPYTNSYTAPWKSINDGYSSLTAYATSVHRKNGNVAFSIRRNYIYDHSSRLYIYNRSGSQLYSLWSPGSDWSYALATFMQFDIDGGIWGYGDFSGSYNDRHLYHFDYSLSIDADISDGTDFFYLGAAEINGTGIWYTNSTENVLYKLNAFGTVLQQIPLNTPRWLCGTMDNGCWVNDTTAGTMIRYDEDGNLVKTASVGFNASAMCHDYNNGAWIRTGYDIYHMTSNGVIDAGPTTLTNANRLEPSKNGVYVVRTSSPDTIWFLNHEGAVEKTRSLNSSSRTVYGAFSYSIADALEFKSAGLIPVSYDPVWGTGGSLEWQEVRKDGYFLPKVKYHRTETTLRGDAVLEKIIMPPAINTQDIQPDGYKYIYLKTDIPLSADIKDYEGKLRTWWGVVD